MKWGVRPLVVALVALLAVTIPLSISAQDSNGPAAQQAANSRMIQPEELAARSASGKPLADVDSLEASAVLPPAVLHVQTAVACNMCFTCGGDWPIFAGAIHAVNTGSLTSERGSACSGNLAASNDQNPFLCCR
jgi:hypothetical protein